MKSDYCFWLDCIILRISLMRLFSEMCVFFLTKTPRALVLLMYEGPCSLGSSMMTSFGLVSSVLGTGCISESTRCCFHNNQNIPDGRHQTVQRHGDLIMQKDHIYS
ncbi:hypothetical protein CHARACLAT_005510 [Characodon lateralis]|uniref:Secreted protein n=1 Tax=Characodon lateralis TaxID=208331 RepID=A0ABU7D8K2_9TELE|nr:hypothetical protein [Characodon lateralis]